MTDRNAPCPCGSGKKYKKCHGVGSGAAPATAAAHTVVEQAAPQAPAPARDARQDEKPFLIHTGRGLDSERTEAERRKHLRRRIQEQGAEPRGTLVYNSGAFFRPPKP